MAFIRLVAIAKDEGAYLPDWIHHHLYFGFNEIVVIHNDCTDNTVEILQRISEKEPRLIVRDGNEFKRKIEIEGGHFQQKSYEQELEMAKRDDYVTHIMYLDIDEFWLTPKLDNSIHEFIKDFSHADSIAFSWHIEYPSNPKIFSPAILGKIKIQKDKHVKSLHRISKKFIRPDIHNGFHENGKYVTTNCEELLYTADTLQGAIVTDQVYKKNLNLIDPSFIFHRIFKSQKEYLTSLLRGRPHENDQKKLKSNRWGYKPQNESIPIIEITLPQENITKINSSFNLFIQFHNLELLIKKAQEDLIFRYKKILVMITNLDYDISNELRIFDCVNVDEIEKKVNLRKEITVHIDKKIVGKRSTKLKGWALTSRSDNQVKVMLSNNQEITGKEYSRTDVLKTYPLSQKKSGFEIEIPDLDFFKLEFNIKNNGKEIKFTKSFTNLMFPICDAALFIENALLSNFILEYGAGTSTRFLVKNSKKCMSVESDANFLLDLLQEISISGYDLTTTPIYVNIGKTKEWGHPVDESLKSSWHKYALQPWAILTKNDIHPDLILIDGRFRVACMLATMANIKKPTKVFFDDYVDRHYKMVIERYCKPLKLIDRAAYFEIVPGMLSANDLIDCFDQFFDPS